MGIRVKVINSPKESATYSVEELRFGLETGAMEIRGYDGINGVFIVESNTMPTEILELSGEKFDKEYKQWREKRSTELKYS